MELGGMPIWQYFGLCLLGGVVGCAIGEAMLRVVKWIRNLRKRGTVDEIIVLRITEKQFIFALQDLTVGHSISRILARLKATSASNKAQRR